MDEQHEGDKILHQDSVEDVVREVLSESNIVAAPLIEIPISVDVDDWDNTSGAWTFVDGVATSTGINDVAFLPLSAAIAAYGGAIFIVPVTINGMEDVNFLFGVSNDGSTNMRVGIDYSYYPIGFPENPATLGFYTPYRSSVEIADLATPLAAGEQHLLACNTVGLAPVVFIDGVPVGAGCGGAISTSKVDVVNDAVSLILYNGTGGAGDIVVDLNGAHLFVVGLPV